MDREEQLKYLQRINDEMRIATTRSERFARLYERVAATYNEWGQAWAKATEEPTLENLLAIERVAKKHGLLLMELGEVTSLLGGDEIRQLELQREIIECMTT